MVAGATFAKGSLLSLQKHHHRSEHWIVVRGTALMTVGESEKMVHESESIYIPIGAMRRLGKFLISQVLGRSDKMFDQKTDRCEPR
ncbi:hypothetical protein [Nitrobacter sp.]|uniref:hypothetical protein n=1 Tax=Nitrobacter sp. TaxID=29420 RepID=UPI003439E2FE